MRLFHDCLIAALLAASAPALAQSAPAADCSYDRARLLALDELQFDQDMAGGWRALSYRPGCQLVAADLLRDYRRAHANEAGLLYWHEGQLRAGAAQYAQAIPLLEHARRPPGVPDGAGWNLYVDATVAFLRRDRAALERAHRTLAAYPPPVGPSAPVVKDGFLIDVNDGVASKIPWPINLDVVEGLLNCFDKPYEVAYGDACRAGKLP